MAAKRTTSAASAPELDHSPRRRDRERTLNELQLALGRLQSANKKVSISAVAKEADVTPALIHNTYPDFAERIRTLVHRSARAQRDDKHHELKLQRAANAQLYKVIADQNKEIVDLASINEALRAEIHVLTRIVEGKVVDLRSGGRASKDRRGQS
ncbi:hypothetical protein Tamer19_58570 [Cupriavidus sp. TA19]|uniref:TetR family transcriptional regulator n=1 Tax=Cupriavidus sp. TA19 TaxID=701108 RepID=UPI00272949A9|nr:TetR family transcriptional regulator [Cupriavidus sp. TA19]GLC96448.1 hypothetical protein Tamer19_58570 [Cupriavidus sp. TA19]